MKSEVTILSNLLSRLEFEEGYELIQDADLKERLLHYYDDVDLNDLKGIDDLKLEGELIERLRAVLKSLKGKRVLIVSDYDTDGIMSLSIMLRLLDKLEIKTNYRIPSRVKDGYGLNEDIAKIAIDHHFDAVMTLDNGVKAIEALALLKKAGIMTIIIDHHEYEKMPDVDIMIHPALLAQDYQKLCTAGMAFLIQKLYLDDPYSNILAMVATIADVVPVTKANRQIVKDGLALFDERRDIAENIRILGHARSYDSEAIAFKIVPRINAISRLDPLYNINHFIDYFKDGMIDLKTASMIDDINEERKIKTLAMQKKAKELVEDAPIQFIVSNDFYEGLCGIVAGSLASELKRPCIVLQGDEVLKGSGRSYGDIDLYSILDRRNDLFLAFGGHKKAVGLTIERSNLSLLKEELRNMKIDSHITKEKIICIKEEELTLENQELIDSFAPFGEGIHKPLFYLDHPHIKSSYLVKMQYPKFTLDSGHELFGFDKDLYGQVPSGAIGTIDRNSYNKHKLTMSLKRFVL